MDTVFRIFMFLLPYGLCLAAYVWVGLKVWRMPMGIPKMIALIILLGGLGYTLYRLGSSVTGILTNDNFEFAIFIVTVFVLFFVSIAMTAGEKEPPSSDKTDTP